MFQVTGLKKENTLTSVVQRLPKGRLQRTIIEFTPIESQYAG